MLITDRHIEYLELVERGAVTVKNHQYVAGDWASGRPEVDHIIAVHAELLGLTRIIHTENGLTVSLTTHGLAVLNDDRECWG